MRSITLLIFLCLCLNIFAFNVNIKCNVCECKPQENIETCICTKNTDADCKRDSHKLLISNHEILIPKKYSLEIIESIIIKGISLYDLLVSFTNDELPKLYRLEFNNCNIKTINEKAFYNVQNVTQLIIKNNGELVLKSDSFNYVENLTYLDLENNNLRVLPENIFANLLNLRELYLDSNKLNISENTLKPLSNLKKIQLRQNEISCISDNLFAANNDLEKIYLSGNKIEYLNRTFVRNIRKLHYLNLDNNPLNCNCKLRDFYDEYKTRNLTITGSCTNHFQFSVLERKHFNCPAELIKLTKTQNNNEVKLNCTIKSDGEPNVTWIFDDTSNSIQSSKMEIIHTTNYVFSILKVTLNPNEHYKNNFTCFLNLNDTLIETVLYEPKITPTKLPQKQIENIEDKIIITQNFTMNNEFNVTWIIYTNQTIELTFNVMNIKSNKYSVNLILKHLEKIFIGKCTLFIVSETSQIHTTNSFNIKNDFDMNMTELFYPFEYKDNVFHIIENNNNNNNNGYCLNYNDNEVKCNNIQTCKISILEIVLILIIIVLIIVFCIYVFCKSKIKAILRRNRQDQENYDNSSIQLSTFPPKKDNQEDNEKEDITDAPNEDLKSSHSSIKSSTEDTINETHPLLSSVNEENIDPSIVVEPSTQNEKLLENRKDEDTIHAPIEVLKTSHTSIISNRDKLNEIVPLVPFHDNQNNTNTDNKAETISTQNSENKIEENSGWKTSRTSIKSSRSIFTSIKSSRNTCTSENERRVTCANINHSENAASIVHTGKRRRTISGPSAFLQTYTSSNISIISQSERRTNAISFMKKMFK